MAEGSKKYIPEKPNLEGKEYEDTRKTRLEKEQAESEKKAEKENENDLVVGQYGYHRKSGKNLKDVEEETKDPTEQLTVEINDPAHLFDDKELKEKEGELKKWLARGVGGYRPVKLEDDTDFMQYWKDYLEKANGVLDGLKKLQDDAFPQLAKAKEEAKGVVDKAPVSRNALDELLRQGAPQMEEPEPPSMVNMAAQMLIGVMGQAFQTYNQSRLAAAESTQTAPVIAEQSADYMAAQFASFEEKRQRVLEINTQLAAQYNRDVVAMMQDFDARADEAERNYQRALLDVAFKKVENDMQLYFKQAEIDMASAQLKAEIGMKGEEHKFHTKAANVEIENRARQFNAEQYSRYAFAMAQMIADEIREKKQALLMEQQYKMEVFGKRMEAANKPLASFGVTVEILDNMITPQLQDASLPLSPKTPEGLVNYGILSGQSGAWNSAVRIMSEKYPAFNGKDNKDSEMWRNFSQNAVYLLKEGYIPKVDFNEDMIKMVTEAKLSGAQIPADIGRYFTRAVEGTSYEMDKIGLSAMAFKGVMGAMQEFQETKMKYREQ